MSSPTNKLMEVLDNNVWIGLYTKQSEKVKEVLKVDNIAAGEKYLGLRPIPEGTMKKERFVIMKERLVKRFTNWAEINISSIAKEVLMKSVAQAIQTYTMGVFKLPVK
jgi:hypothetical protein